MHLVDKSRTKAPHHGGNPAAETDISTICAVDSSLQSSLNATQEETEPRAPLI